MLVQELTESDWKNRKACCKQILSNAVPTVVDHVDRGFAIGQKAKNCRFWRLNGYSNFLCIHMCRYYEIVWDLNSENGEA